MVVVVLLALVAVFGPLVATHSPNGFVGSPYCGHSGSVILGCDYLGRDVLSRFLHGGRTVFALSIAATALGVGVGLIVGLLAAYSSRALDDTLMRAMDVMMAFPPIIFALLVISMLGTKVWLLVVTVAAAHAPRVARLVRGAALEVVGKDFIRFSEALGESRTRIILAGILPNISSPLLVETGLRLTYSIGIIASLSFMGFGLQPPASDWGLMINENRGGIALQPWGVVLPIIAIGLLTVGMNLIADGMSRVMIGIDRPVEQSV
jgi:peptide/nickel transport system permease protein